MEHQSQILGSEDVRRACTRMAHEIIERNRGLDDVVLVGIQRGGVWLARMLAEDLERIEASVPTGAIDVSLHRDDIGLRPVLPTEVTQLPVSIDDAIVVIVDDVLFTGRTVRACLDALGEYGRPRVVQLAVMVDRGHRELPLRPDYIGKNLPTSLSEQVRADPDGVVLIRGGEL